MVAVNKEKEIAQPVITCSKSETETPEQYVESVQS